MRVASTTTNQLNWLVAKCEGLTVGSATESGVYTSERRWFQPSTDWAQGGPILTHERISRTIDHSGLWIAYWTDGYTEGEAGKKWMQCDRSELVAGLRCYVVSKMGEEVEVPDGLL